LGGNAYQVAEKLGQAPLTQLGRNQQFTQRLLQQWQPPDLRLTGEDLLSVATQQAAQNAAARQAALQAQLTGQTAAAGQQAAAQAAQIGAIGKIGSSAISALTSPSEYGGTSLLGSIFGGGGAPYDVYGGQYASATMDSTPVATSGETGMFGS
jgi:hypothetical protein